MLKSLSHHRVGRRTSPPVTNAGAAARSYYQRRPHFTEEATNASGGCGVVASHVHHQEPWGWDAAEEMG
jgi:hypothetical protein